MENYIEKGQERIPSREEVLEIIFRHAENAVLVQELSDDQGLYLLEAKVEVGKPGEFIEYLYMRKGDFPNKNSSSETTIFMMYYKNGEYVTGWNIAEYKSDTGKLEDVNIGEKLFKPLNIIDS